MNVGIPTTFNHRRYRSRLEAKWAAFFAILGWEYEYEPFDCDGWIPDFALIGDKGNITLVEVKPVAAIPNDVCEKVYNATKNDGLFRDVLIVGLRPLVDKYNEVGVGWLGEWVCGNNCDAPDPCPDVLCWGLASMGRWGGRIGFCHEDMSYGDRITGEYDGNCGNGVHWDEVNKLWSQASNAVQWRGK